MTTYIADDLEWSIIIPNNPNFYIFIAFYIFVASNDRDFKFGM